MRGTRTRRAVATRCGSAPLSSWRPFPTSASSASIWSSTGPRHADRWVLTGTHDGELLGIAPTGRSVRVEGATFTVLGDDGLVVEDFHFVDIAGLLGQLGVI
jgi:predicted ester cyclase